MNSIAVLHLGLIDYGTALRLQETLVELRKQQRIPDVLLLLEHPPVITLGRNAKPSNIVASREFLAGKGVEVFEINRGGDVTFHGPGQLVAYPIFDLRDFTPKLGAVDYVRKLEEVLMRTCAQYRIETQRIRGMTGVWTMAGAAGVANTKETMAQAELPPSAERKIAAIGVHISRGVTSHGFALNVSTDLEFFKLIVPCGLSGKPVTSIERETGSRLSIEEVLPVVTRNFGSVFGSQILWLESLDELLASAADVAAPAPTSRPRTRPPKPPKNSGGCTGRTRTSPDRPNWHPAGLFDEQTLGRWVTDQPCFAASLFCVKSAVLVDYAETSGGENHGQEIQQTHQPRKPSRRSLATPFRMKPPRRCCAATTCPIIASSSRSSRCTSSRRASRCSIGSRET